MMRLCPIRYGGYVAPPPSDPYAVSLLHFNGANGDTATHDEYPPTWTKTAFGGGGGVLSTIEKKFGTASMILTEGDHIESNDFSFTGAYPLGTNDFCIEMFIRVADSWVDGVANRAFAGDSTNIRMYHYTGGSGTGGELWFEFDVGYTKYIAFSTSLNKSTWYHIAVTREGDVYRTFFDGVLANSITVSGMDFTLPSGFGVGGNTSLATFLGNIDEFRFTIGDARYTSSFTPPSGAFSPP